MATIRYLATALATGEQLDEVPLPEYRYSRVLNGPGGWSAQTSHRHEKFAGDNRNNIAYNATAIYALAGDVILFGGIVRQPNVEIAEGTTNSLTLGGDGLLGYFKGDGSNTGRFIDEDRTYTQVDVFDVMADIITWAQTRTGGSIGLEVAYRGPAAGAKSGVLIDRVIKGYELRNVGAELEAIADAYGIEFEVEWRWELADQPPTIVPVLALHYPRRGRQTGIVLEVGKNVELLQYSADGFTQVNRGIGVGAGDAERMLTVVRSDTTLIAPNGPYPLLETVVTHKTVNRAPTLRRHVDAELALRKLASRTAKVRMIEAADVAIGDFIPGDEVRLFAEDGYLQETGDLWRVDGFDVSIDNDGKLSAELDLLASANLYA